MQMLDGYTPPIIIPLAYKEAFRFGLTDQELGCGTFTIVVDRFSSGEYWSSEVRVPFIHLSRASLYRYAFTKRKDFFNPETGDELEKYLNECACRLSFGVSWNKQQEFMCFNPDEEITKEDFDRRNLEKNQSAVLKYVPRVIELYEEAYQLAEEWIQKNKEKNNDE